MQRSTWHFETDATYVVVGGLGGLGRAIVRWMVDKGARNFILPSRSGPSSQAASEMLSEVTRKGAQVLIPRCDASSVEDVRALLEDCAHLPPIKGCINSAVDLQVIHLTLLFLAYVYIGKFVAASMLTLAFVTGRCLREHDIHTMVTKYSIQGRLELEHASTAA